MLYSLLMSIVMHLTVYSSSAVAPLEGRTLKSGPPHSTDRVAFTFDGQSCNLYLIGDAAQVLAAPMETRVLVHAAASKIEPLVNTVKWWYCVRGLAGYCHKTEEGLADRI